MNLTDEFDRLATYLHDQMVGMPEPQQRVYLHDLLTEQNSKLQKMFGAFGIHTGADARQVTSERYKAMYDGLTAMVLEQRRQLKPGTLIKYMGPEELRDSVMGVIQISKMMTARGKGTSILAMTIHRSIGAALRLYLIDNGYAKPEDLLPAQESVDDVRKRLAKGGDLFLVDLADDPPQEGC